MKEVKANGQAIRRAKSANLHYFLMRSKSDTVKLRAKQIDTGRGAEPQRKLSELNRLNKLNGLQSYIVTWEKICAGCGNSEG